MNQQKNFREKEQQKNKGSLTLEASIVLVFFLVAYMAILSVINMYRGQVLIQNAANQTAQEIAQYTYLLKKAGLSEFGKQASDNATKFTDDTNKLVGTVFAFFEATSEGLDAGKEIANDMQTQTFPEDIFQLSSQLEDMQENADTIEKQADNIYSEYRTMMDAGSEYFSDPAAIFNGMLAILKDTTCDSIKIAVATPITKSLMNKYLAAYPADHLENLGVVGGNGGISYWGSSILLDMQSVEVCAYYKMKIDLPFLDLFEYQLKTTSSTRAWIGDGTHNDAKSASGETSKTDGASKTGRGVELDEQATGLPGFGNDSSLGFVAGGSDYDVEPDETIESTTNITRLNYVTSNGLVLESTQGKTTTVLGVYLIDTGAILEELGNVKSTDFGARDGGFNLLNTPDELYIDAKQFWAEYNQPWLDNAIARQDIILIATEPTEDNLYRINKETGERELTGFGREYNYLISHGYKYDPVTKNMIKELE